MFSIGSRRETDPLSPDVTHNGWQPTLMRNHHVLRPSTYELVSNGKWWPTSGRRLPSTSDTVHLLVGFSLGTHVRMMRSTGQLANRIMYAPRWGDRGSDVTVRIHFAQFAFYDVQWWKIKTARLDKLPIPIHKAATTTAISFIKLVISITDYCCTSRARSMSMSSVPNATLTLTLTYPLTSLINTKLTPCPKNQELSSAWVGTHCYG